MNVNEPCVSLAAATLSPDLRVNYAHGMVLGLDEFVQEQRHRLTKSDLLYRAMHGYGTVYGLHVTAEPVDGPDVVIGVGKGMGVDHWGRDFVVRCAQCAHLGAWLAARVQADPTVLAQHAGISGEHTVYVVASYASCLDNLVPLPGTPCSSSAQTTVPSRVRDAWDVDLRWQPPPMPRWDTDRRLARLLDAVEVVPGLPSAQSAKADLLAAVLDLPAQAALGPSDLGSLDWPPQSPSGGPSGAFGYQLPAETAADDLDEVLTVWATQVRPLLEPDLTDPEESWDPAILLASLTFTVPDPFDPAAPVVTSWDEPDDAGRPYLLHTELIQELRGEHDVPGVSTVPAPTVPEPAIELVTLAPTILKDGELRVGAWFHLDRPVQLAAPVHVLTERGTSGDFEVAAVGGAGGFSDRWRLVAPPGFTVADGEQLAATFEPADVFVGDMSTTVTDLLAGGGGDPPLDLLNETPAGGIEAYARVQVPPDDPVAPAVPAARASVPFLTVTTDPDAGDLISFELWFHPQPRGEKDDVPVVRLSPESLSGFDEVTGAPLSPLSPQGGPNPEQDPDYRNVWRWSVRRPDQLPAYVRLMFSTRDIGVDAPGQGVISLADWIKASSTPFVGEDADSAQIVAFHRLAGKPQ